MYDMVIRNGLVVDGTGAAAVRADIAIGDGKIIEVGKVGDGAKRTIDASDLVVAPGFVDPHTHYDAQICWDSMVTPSSWHGVTSVVMGNCGVGIAPCKPERRETAASDLVFVEGMPLDVLNKGITWDWTTFPEFMSAAARRRSAVNLGFLAPLTPFRHFVMGEESLYRAANDGERAQIKSLIKEAVLAGALGFSTSNQPGHRGYKGLPLACRQADRAELRAYANALKEIGRGTVEMALTTEIPILSQDDYDVLDLLLTESGRPVTWLAILDRDDMPDACNETLRFADPLIARGSRPQVSVRPLMITIEFGDPAVSGMNAGRIVLGMFPCFKQAFARSAEHQKKLFRDPAFRASFREQVKMPSLFVDDWNRTAVHEAPPAMQSLIGQSVQEIARSRGKDALDTFFDLALESDFAMVFTYELFNGTQSRVDPLVKDSRTLIGLSDAGAHTDFLCDAGYSTFLLKEYVRERNVLTLEQAIQRLTLDPATLFGLHDRGRIAPGMAADIVVFDYDTVGSNRRAEISYDMPGGAKRQIMHSRGVECTVVNGTVVYEHGKLAGALPGQVLRSR